MCTFCKGTAPVTFSAGGGDGVNSYFPKQYESMHFEYPDYCY